MNISQTKFTKGKGLSVSNIFALFLMSIFIFIGISFYGMIYGRVAETVSGFQGKNIHFYLEANANALRAYLRDRIFLLRDHARFPIFTNMVMQPDSDATNLMDFMNTLSFLGDRPTLVVSDFQGKLIHSTGDVSQNNFATAPWFPDIISGSRKDYMGIIHISRSGVRQPFWQFAVPIISNNYAEGVLIAEYPLDIRFLKQKSSFTKKHRLSLLYNGQPIAAEGHVGKETLLIKEKILDRLELCIEVDESEIRVLKQKLLESALLEISLGMLLFSLIFYFIGRKLFVVPQQDLISITQELDKTNRTLEGEIQIRKETEQILLQKTREAEASESKLEIILNTAADGIITMTHEGTIEKINPAAKKLFGYETDILIGRNINMLMPEPYRSQHDGFLKNYLETGVAKIIGIGRDVMGRRRDGSVFPLRLSVGESTDGNQRFFTGVLSDLTERKQIEDELTRLSLVASKTDNTVIITDKEDLIEWVNDGFTRMTGYTFDEVMGKKPGKLLQGPLTDRETVRTISDALKEKKSITCEILNYHKDGHPYWISLSVTPILDENGDVVRFIGIQSDISEKKLAEAELQKAKENAEAANRAKSDFLASMSHEIRTPMNSIIGMADMLRETPLTPEQKQYVKIFQTSGETLLKIINEILDLSKIETGCLTLESTDFDIGSLFHELREAFITRAREKGIDLVFDIQPDMPAYFIADSTRLHQILLNLIGNALKFTEKGGILIKARMSAPIVEKECVVSGNVKQEQDKTVMLLFSVADTGIGIPPDKANLIFEKFTQADASTTRKYGGSGLGLTISARLVELMGGRIWVESAVGEGSTFYFTIQAEIQTEPRKAVRKPAPAIEPEKLRPLHILLVEDFPDNRMLILSYLKKTPYQIDIAENGEVAVEKFTEGKYDLVLMDMQMPVMDGYTATRNIREWEQAHSVPETPIIALTAHALMEDRQKCLDAGCTSYLTKPLRKADLLEGIIEQTQTSESIGKLPSDNTETTDSTEANDDTKATEANNVEQEEKIIAYVDEDLEELVPGFLENRHKDIRTMENALEKGDYDTIRGLGHSMKGAGGSYGFDGITVIGRSLEAAAKSDDADEIRRLISDLSSYLEKVEIVYE
ncbi:PAS domain S-box protein [Desulfobacterales bacterium HSG2]|nr:PAS domain S-box protein [Desulfobacterales bacterium HSG2]